MQLSVLVAMVGGLVVGIAAGTTIVVPAEVVILLLVISLAIGVVRRKNAGSIFAPHLLAFGLFLLCVALGLWRADLARPVPSELAAQVGREVVLSGLVVREPDVRELQQMLYVRTNDTLVLVSTDRYQPISYGDVVTISGTLAVPETFTTDLGRTFNYPGYLLARGVSYRVSFAQVEVAQTHQGHRLLEWLYVGKHSFTTSLEKSIAEPYVGLAEGLLLGEKRALGDDISKQFQRTGLTHIVVLSGYNVMLVVAFCLYLFSFVFGLRGRLVAGVVAITLFALLVGLSATVVRASLMAGLVLVAQATGRRYDVLRALLLSGALMLIINPYLLLFDIGFQLSFMATLGLVLFAPHFESTVAIKGVTTLRGFLLATVVTQIAVLPLLAYHIGQISLISVVANVLVLPVVPVAMFTTFVTGVAGLFSMTIALPFALVSESVLAYILFITGWLSRLPFAVVVVPTITPTVVLVWYGLYAAGYWWWQRRAKSDVNDETLTDWHIVEESTLQTKARRALPAAPHPQKDEVPVFFR